MRSFRCLVRASRLKLEDPRRELGHNWQTRHTSYCLGGCLHIVVQHAFSDERLYYRALEMTMIIVSTMSGSPGQVADTIPVLEAIQALTSGTCDEHHPSPTQLYEH